MNVNVYRPQSNPNLEAILESTVQEIGGIASSNQLLYEKNEQILMAASRLRFFHNKAKQLAMKLAWDELIEELQKRFYTDALSRSDNGRMR